MANTYKSTLIAAQDAAKIRISHGLVNGDDLTGTLLVATAQYTLLGTESATAPGDAIQLAYIPAGSVIIPQLSSVACSDPGATLTLNIGDPADSDRYAAGIVLSNGGSVGFASTAAQPDGVLNPLRLTSPSLVAATVASASGLTAGVKLTFTIVYRAKA